MFAMLVLGGAMSRHFILIGITGGPDRDRTDDLFHAITTIACNLLILGASVATKSILEHPRTALSTFASTFKKSKEEVSEIGFLGEIECHCARFQYMDG
jgi:hypothetical protein